MGKVVLFSMDNQLSNMYKESLINFRNIMKYFP